jgi:hypothetical protein
VLENLTALQGRLNVSFSSVLLGFESTRGISTHLFGDIFEVHIWQWLEQPRGGCQVLETRAQTAPKVAFI